VVVSEPTRGFRPTDWIPASTGMTYLELGKSIETVGISTRLVDTVPRDAVAQGVAGDTKRFGGLDLVAVEVFQAR
jgi:hypothetical protein